MFKYRNLFIVAVLSLFWGFQMGSPTSKTSQRIPLNTFLYPKLFESFYLSMQDNFFFCLLLNQYWVTPQPQCGGWATRIPPLSPKGITITNHFCREPAKPLKGALWPTVTRNNISHCFAQINSPAPHTIPVRNIFFYKRCANGGAFFWILQINF